MKQIPNLGRQNIWCSRTKLIAMATWGSARLLLMVMLFYILQTRYVTNCTFLEGVCARYQNHIWWVAIPTFLPLIIDYKYEVRVSFSGTKFILNFMKIDMLVGDGRAVMPYHLITASDNVKIFITDAGCYPC